MKSSSLPLTILILYLLYIAPLYCQNYLNIQHLDGSYTNVLVESLQKIIFDTPVDKMTIVLTNTHEKEVALNTIQHVVFSNDNPLPVELVLFTALTKHNSVVLYWRTATEVNNYGFDIERTSPISTWRKVGFVHGQGTSSTPNEYGYTDTPSDGATYQYRLKQIDMDGKFVYSRVVNISTGIPTMYDLRQNYPNPFNPSTRIAYQIPADGFVTLRIYDLLGKEVATIVNENKKTGRYEVSFDGSKLSSGMYICRMKSGVFSNAIKMILSK